MEMTEHEKRVWSIDISTADPMVLASGSDDGSIKLWSINQAILLFPLSMDQRSLVLLLTSIKFWYVIVIFFVCPGSLFQGPSIATIKTKANVCCVKFAPDSGRSLAFGSADHKIYYYDLRNSKFPLRTLIGHDKTVSYVEFMDSMNLVSSSTDNTLKLWDLSISQSRLLDSPLRTFSGHLNVRVGFSSGKDTSK